MTSAAYHDETPKVVTRAAFAAELALIALIGVVFAKLLWAFAPGAALGPGSARLTPPTLAAEGAGRSSAALSGLNPFRRAAVAEGPTASEDPLEDVPLSALNLRVAGVRAAREGGVGAAIILTPDNRQAVYRVGEEIINGVTLREVRQDRVILWRNGAAEALLFGSESLSVISRDPGAAPTGRAPVAPTPEQGGEDIPRVALADLLAGVAPGRPEDEGVLVNPRGDGVAFAAAGFQPGDTVRQINGQDIDGATQLTQSLSGIPRGSVITVTIEREEAGQTVRFIVE